MTRWKPFSVFKKKSRGFTVPRAQKTVLGNKPLFRRVSRTAFVTMLICLLLGTGGWGIYRLLVSSDIFRLTEVTVLGNRTVRERKILEVTGLTRGVNLLEFDIPAAELRAMELDWVDRIDISLSLPTKAVVKIREYEPLALVGIDGTKGSQLYYVSREGDVFAPVKAGEDIDFPVITGDLKSLGLKEEQIADGTLAADALAFLHLAARGNAILPIQAISELHVDSTFGLTVYLVDHTFPIFIGSERISSKYYRLVQILEQLYRKDKMDSIKEIRMDYMENKVLVATNSPGR